MANPVPLLAPTIRQCAAVLARDDLLTLIEDAVRRERVSLALLRSACGRGLSGAGALSDALDELSAAGCDRWMRTLVPMLEAAGLPAPRLEVPMFDGSRLRARLDGLLEEALIALEVDDWETHGSREAQERDRQRDRWLFRAQGITTIRVTPREIRDRPQQVVEDVVRAYRRGRS